jgi:hypothetical protein
MQLPSPATSQTLLEAESYLRSAIAREKHLRWFEITMHDGRMYRVQDIERLEDYLCYLAHHMLWEASASLDKFI